MPNPRDFDNLIAEYEKLYFAQKKSKTLLTKLNKISENIAEYIADIEVQNKFGALFKREVKVPVRGVKGAPVFDKLYELTNGDFVIIEAKFQYSPRGRVNEQVYRASPSGEVEEIFLRGETEQLSGKWVSDRITEIHKHNSPLANKLRRAVEQGKLHVIEYRADVKITLDGIKRTLSISAIETDETQNVLRFFDVNKPTFSATRSNERSIAFFEGNLRKDIKNTKYKLKTLSKVLRDAKKTLKNRIEYFKSVQKKLATVKKPLIKKKYQDLVDKTGSEVLKARQDLIKAQNAVEKLSKEIELLEKYSGSVRATQDARLAQAKLTKIADLRAARAVTSTTDAGVRATGARAIEERKLADKATEVSEHAKLALRVEEGIAKTSGISLSVKRSSILLSSSRMFLKVGRIVFLVFKVVDPILLVFDIKNFIDFLINWSQRKKIEERKEWHRISWFLYGVPQVIESIYGIKYQTSLRDSFIALINHKITNTDYNNLLFWLDKWNNDKQWTGFVYAQVFISLERQQEIYSDDDESFFNVKYFINQVEEGFPALDTKLTDTPLKHFKTESSRFSVGPQDKRNNSTLGREAPNAGSEYYLAVDISYLKVTSVYPAPILTPFDFITIKCRNLISEIVAFLSKYDENIIVGLNIRDEINQFLKINWIKDYKFSYPLNNKRVQFCFDVLFWTVDNLETHALRDNDLQRKDETDRYNIGFYRRLNILRKVSSPEPKYNNVRPMYKVGLELLNLLDTDDNKYLNKNIDSDLNYLNTEYLSEMAIDIDADLKRVFGNCKENPQFEYNIKQ